MKALIYNKYGKEDVLKIEEVSKPMVKSKEVLVQVKAVSINTADCFMLQGKPLPLRMMSGIFKPKNQILGADISGDVVAVGEEVTKFKVGQSVIGDLSNVGFGGLAEFVSVNADVLVLKPSEISYEMAAAIPMASVTALQGLRDKGHIASGQKVLVNGASGGVGSFAVQIAKAFDTEVTAVCSSRHIENIKNIGADHVIDYTKENFTKGSERYDLILGANGYHPIKDYRNALTSKGIYVMSGGTGKQMMESMLHGKRLSSKTGKTLTNISSKTNKADLEFVVNLLVKGQITPMIDAVYSLEEGAVAFKYMLDKKAKGKVIVKI